MRDQIVPEIARRERAAALLVRGDVIPHDAVEPVVVAPGKRRPDVHAATPPGGRFWNDALLQARERRARLQDARKAAAGIPTPDMKKLYPQLLRAAREWSELILSSSATPTQKRDLILSTVEGLDCLDRADGRIHFRLRLIMTSSIEWWA